MLVGGKPFTSYLWTANLSKPILFPVRTDTGQVVTRGFPLEPQADESKDHPHHSGLWFNYGDVGGADFWGNSAAIRNQPPGPKHGNIVHRSVDEAKGGAGKGELAVTADWVMPDGKPALREKTRFTFAAAPGRLAIDRVATLTATAAAVPLPDNKEGMLALRLARSLEHPGGKNPEATGSYRSSEGKVGDDVWGTRARWMMLTGKVGGEPVTIAIIDHPKNPGYPTYWHARGYGLFAANPLGQKVFSKGKETLDLTVDKAHPARFAYRIVVAVTPGQPRGDRGRIETLRRRCEIAEGRSGRIAEEAAPGQGEAGPDQRGGAQRDQAGRQLAGPAQRLAGVEETQPEAHAPGLVGVAGSPRGAGPCP